MLNTDRRVILTILSLHPYKVNRLFHSHKLELLGRYFSEIEFFPSVAGDEDENIRGSYFRVLHSGTQNDIRRKGTVST